MSYTKEYSPQAIAWGKKIIQEAIKIFKKLRYLDEKFTENGKKNTIIATVPDRDSHEMPKKSRN